MSPKVVPKHKRSSDHEWVNRYLQADALQRQGKCTSASPYQPTCSHSYFADLLIDAEARQRQKKALESPVLRGRDQGALDFSDHDIKEVRERLRTTLIKNREQRDIGSNTVGDGLRPSLPGYLVEVWGQAARSAGTLEDAFGTVPLEAGMIDTVSSVPTVKIARLSGGAAVAVASADNVAVQETDPTSTSASSPVASVEGQTDVSRQLFELSQPGIDRVVTDDLSRDHATKFDIEVINGTATSGRTRGLLSTSGILSVTGSVTNSQTFLNSCWQAYSQLAGSSGFGASDTSGYITILHPRRWAWFNAGISGVMPPGSALPGQVVVSAGIPSILGAGTNEDVAIVCVKSQVLLLSSGPTIRVREDVGSTTLTVRFSTWRDLAVLVRNPTAVAKVVGLTPPSGF